jgi:hypothetical protein
LWWRMPDWMYRLADYGGYVRELLRSAWNRTRGLLGNVGFDFALLAIAVLIGTLRTSGSEFNEIVSGAVWGAIALAVLLGAVFVANFILAPPRLHWELRRDAEGKLSDAKAEIAQLNIDLDIARKETAARRAPAAFPDVHVELIKLTWREEERNHVFTLPVNVTNRHDQPVSLQFELGFEREHLRTTQWVKRLQQEGMPLAVLAHNVLPPLGVGAFQTERFELHYWVATHLIEHLMEEFRVSDQTHKSPRPSG